MKLAKRPPTPAYAKPTASILMKDKELQRIGDRRMQTFTAESILHVHNENLRIDRQEPGRLATGKQFQSTIKQDTLKPEKSQAQESQAVEIKELSVKSMDKHIIRSNKSLAKNEGAGAGGKGLDSPMRLPFASSESQMYTKPITEVLSEILIELLQQPSYKLITDFKDVETEDFGKTFFLRIEQLKTAFVVDYFKLMGTKAQYLCDLLLKNAFEFSQFAALLQIALESLPLASESFEACLDVLGNLAEKMAEVDTNTMEQMFLDFFLPNIVEQIKKNAPKREVLCHLIYSFIAQDAFTKLKVCKQLAELIADVGETLKCYSILIKYDTVYQEELHSYFISIATQGLQRPSPIIRTCGLSIFSYVAGLNLEACLDVVKYMKRLSKDPWWEVKAQLIQCAGIILTSQEENDEVKEVVNDVFKPTASRNVLRVALYYLAPALKQHPDLGMRYLECLLAIPTEPRKILLSNNDSDETSYVMGTDSHRYKSSRLPEIWDSKVLATNLSELVKREKLVNLDESHIQVLDACLNSKPDEEWKQVFETLKDLLFVGLCDAQICNQSSGVLLKLIRSPDLTGMALKASTDTLLKILKLLHETEVDEECQTNCYQFLKSLFWDSDTQEIKEFVYKVLKDFSESNLEIFENSQLMDIMNDIVTERRGEIFPDASDSPGDSRI